MKIALVIFGLISFIIGATGSYLAPMSFDGKWPLLQLIGIALFLSFFIVRKSEDKKLNLGLIWCGAGLLMLAFPPFPVVFTSLFAFVPLLYLIHQRKNSFNYLQLFTFFFIWNTLVTWWVCNSTLGGGYVAVIANSLIMTIPWVLYQKADKILGKRYGYLGLISFWMTFEFIHLHWELSWTWLNLGNSLAMFPVFYQWAEYTGVLPAAGAILLINVLIYEAFINSGKSIKEQRIKDYILPIILVLVPTIFSVILYFTNEEGKETRTVTLVQPNIDPWSEKFDRTTKASQLEKLLELSEGNSEYVVWPETALPFGIWTHDIETDPSLYQINAWIQHQPTQPKIITGISLYEMYSDSNKTETARELNNNRWYDSYNAAAILDGKPSNIQHYIKDKLVPGSEIMPYSKYLSFLLDFMVDLGGISGTLGNQKQQNNFTFGEDKFAPVICYESIYGEYTSNFTTNEADAIFIMTNDAWWNNSAGYKQHLYYASLRAVENRKNIARSANTGISAFIDSKGKILERTEYDEETTLTGEIHLNNTKTVYSKYGNWLNRVAIFLACFVLFLMISRGIKKKKVNG